MNQKMEAAEAVLLHTYNRSKVYSIMEKVFIYMTLTEKNIWILLRELQYVLWDMEKKRIRLH